ncbi:bifunctional 2',3'-cyclic-nucleotide 2'-phosphodiesterase/3'-nucleotidase [Thalassobius vesicularis]|nr:bifunctional 2',3'-cyclic-nucleotide 2'-phosphodiesterase/3'-nucleotidase [Thalassobius vesicularis]
MPKTEQSGFRPAPIEICDEEIHLRLLQTTDIHVNLLPYNYFTDRPDPQVGLSQLAGMIRQARAEVPNTLLLETGDFLQGTPLGDVYAERNPEGEALHPAITMMNALSYDACGPGNHEFNYGLEFLTNVVSGAQFPVVLANAARKLGPTPDQDDTLFPPFTLLERTFTDQAGQSHSLKIGVIGFVPPQISIWDRRHLENKLYVRGITQAARAWVPKLKQAGADLIIALSHSGIGNAEDFDLQENASIPLAAIDGIDVLLCGHQHRRFPGPTFEGVEGVDHIRGTLHGKPAVMAGFFGSDLGVIELALKRDDAGKWQIARHKSYLKPIPEDVLENAQIPVEMEAEHTETLCHIRTAVATVAQPLHTYFAFAGFDLATRAVAMAQLDFVRQKLGEQDIPLLSAASPFRAGGHAGPDNYTEVPAGALTLRGLADLYQFPNTLNVLRVSGAQLRDWLERAAGKFRQLLPGRPDQPLLDPDFPSYNFDSIFGLDYQIDLSQPAKFALDGSLAHPSGTRIRDLEYQGNPLKDDQEFLLVTNSYRAGGGGNFAGAGPKQQVLAVTEEIRTILSDWARGKQLEIPRQMNWRFRPMPGTTTLLESAPKARDYLSGLPLNLTEAGPAENGFSYYRLAL